MLLGLALGLICVFGIAAWLNPFQADGRARTMETHLQLGLPPCQFRFMTGVPCPSCGMTTSFALLMHGDLADSLRANAVGTLLAFFCLALIPWSLACAWTGRPLIIRSFERGLTWTVVILLVLMLSRWFIVLSLGQWSH